MVDVAIVGGGVSGCYCAYRLARDGSAGEIHLFEMSDRIGGRLFSVKADAIPEYPIEFGGMFFTSQQSNVHGLIKQLRKKDAAWHDRLLPRAVAWSPRHQFLRGKELTNDMYPKPDAVIPYDLRSDEKLAPYHLLEAKIKAQFPKLDELWPYKAGKTPSETDKYLRGDWKGRPLHEWGFWNFLSEISSNEAYELMLVAIGCSSGLRNSNAYDAIRTFLFEDQAQYYYQLHHGYQQLPEVLIEAAQQGGVVRHMEHELAGVEACGDSLHLHFTGRHEPVVAKKLILALPRRALERIEFTSVFRDDFKETDLKSVICVPASKLFLGFASPWWKQGKLGESFVGNAEVAASYTDLPIRQCYYYGQPKIDEPALLLASYADDAAESFWKGLKAPDGCGPGFPDLSSGAGAVGCATKPMVDTAFRQLQTMHPGFTVTQPIGANFVDWGEDPYGAGWHAWKAYHRSWEVAKHMRRPNPKLPVFICGEAFSTTQGWVEGAVNTAELVLQEGFELERADWLPANYELETKE